MKPHRDTTLASWHQRRPDRFDFIVETWLCGTVTFDPSIGVKGGMWRIHLIGETEADRRDQTIFFDYLDDAQKALVTWWQKS